jgi:hypothetical protein
MRSGSQGGKAKRKVTVATFLNRLLELLPNWPPITKPKSILVLDFGPMDA